MNPGANNTIDIAATFQALYGYVPAEIPIMPVTPSSTNPYYVNHSNTPLRTPGQGLASLTGLNDMIGRPVFMPITITTKQANSTSTVEYDFPFSMLSIKNKKIIKETPMVERGGSVIEEVGLGAWEIEMKGFLIDANNQFPDDQLTSLYKLYVSNQLSTNTYSVNLRCALSDIFLGGNTDVVITEIEIPAKAKVIGVRDFSIKMVQDGVLTLYPVNINAPVAPAISMALSLSPL
jgi:hypothetical protein